MAPSPNEPGWIGWHRAAPLDRRHAGPREAVVEAPTFRRVAVLLGEESDATATAPPRDTDTQEGE